MGMMLVGAILLLVSLLRAASKQAAMCIVDIIPAGILGEVVFHHIRLAEFPSVSATCTMFNQLCWKALITRFSSSSNPQIDYRKVYEAYLMSEPDEKKQYKALFARYCKNYHRFNLFNDDYKSMLKSLFSAKKVKLNSCRFPELTLLLLKRCHAKCLKVLYDTGLLSEFYFPIAIHVVDHISVSGLLEIRGLNLGTISMLIPRLFEFKGDVLKDHIVNGKIIDVEVLVTKTRQFSSGEVQLILQFPDLFPLDLILSIIRQRPGDAVRWIRFLLRNRNRTLSLSNFDVKTRNFHANNILLECSHNLESNLCHRIVRGDEQVEQWLEEIRSGSLLLDELHIETALLQGLPDDQVLALIGQTTKEMPFVLGQIAANQKRSAAIVEKLSTPTNCFWNRSEPFFYFEENPSLFFDWHPRFKWCSEILTAFLCRSRISKEAMVVAFKTASENGKLSLQLICSVLSSDLFALHPYFDDLFPVILEHCLTHKFHILLTGFSNLRPLQAEVKKFFAKYTTKVLLDYLPKDHLLSHVTSHISSTVAVFSIILEREHNGAELLKAHMNNDSYLVTLFATESSECDMFEVVFNSKSYYKPEKWIWPVAVFLARSEKDGVMNKVKRYVEFIVKILDDRVPEQLNFLRSMVQETGGLVLFSAVHSVAGYASFRKLIELMLPDILEKLCENKIKFEICYYERLKKNGLFDELKKILWEQELSEAAKQSLLEFIPRKS